MRSDEANLDDIAVPCVLMVGNHALVDLNTWYILPPRGDGLCNINVPEWALYCRNFEPSLEEKCRNRMYKGSATPHNVYTQGKPRSSLIKRTNSHRP